MGHGHLLLSWLVERGGDFPGCSPRLFSALVWSFSVWVRSGFNQHGAGGKRSYYSEMVMSCRETFVPIFNSASLCQFLVVKRSCSNYVKTTRRYSQFLVFCKFAWSREFTRSGALLCLLAWDRCTCALQREFRYRLRTLDLIPWVTILFLILLTRKLRLRV